MDVFTCTSAGTFVRLAKQEPIPKVVYCAVPALSHDHNDPEEVHATFVYAITLSLR